MQHIQARKVRTIASHWCHPQTVSLRQPLLQRRTLCARAPEARNGAALVVGAGDGAGQAIARRFARGGYAACVVRRPSSVQKLNKLVHSIAASGGVAHAFPADVRREDQVVELVEHVESQVGPIEVCVFNIGANVRFPVVDTTERVYRKVWEMAALSGFLVGRECARRMLPRQRGTIIFSGATASLRGSSGFCAFSGAKFALRALSQSMARELGPRGIHVAHAVIDGAVDTPWVRENFAEQYGTLKPMEGVLEPDAIAEQYWVLHAQPRNAWTHELDLRPWTEKW